MERGTGCLQKKLNSSNAAGIFVLFQCERRPRKREKKAGEERRGRASQDRAEASPAFLAVGCRSSLEPSPSSQLSVPSPSPPAATHGLT